MVIFIAATVWVQNTTSAAIYENGISQAVHCMSTNSVIFPSAGDITSVPPLQTY